MVGVPRIPGGVARRPRLFQTLASHDDAALIVLRASAGAGKTVLAADYIRSENRSCVWVTVDSSYATRSAFWTVVLQRLASFLGDDPKASLPQDFDVRDVTVRTRLREAFELNPAQLTLVIDDYQLLENTEVEEDIAWLATTFRQIRFMVLTRSRTGLESPDLMARLDTAVICMDELLLTPKEAEQVIKSIGAEALGNTAEVMAVTAGFPASVRALANGVALLESRGRQPSHEDIVFLAAQPMRTVLKAYLQDKNFGEFLCKTSIPESMSVDLARDLTGSNCAEVFLQHAEDLGLALSSGQGTDLSYTYSAPLREALLLELHERLPAIVPSLQRRCAQWYLANGSSLAALQSALLAGDLGLANAVIRGRWSDLFQFHGKSALALLRDQPLRKLQRYPIMLFFIAICYNASKIHKLRAAEYFAFAITSAQLHSSRLRVTDRVVIQMILAISFRLSGLGEQARKAATLCLDLAASLSAEQRDEVAGLLPAIYVHCGLSLYEAGELDRALDSFGLAYICVVSEHTATTRFQAGGLVAMAHAINGEIEESRLWLREIESKSWPLEWYSKYIGAGYRIATALVRIEEHNFVAAEAALAELAPHRTTIEHWSQMVYAETLLALLQSNAGHQANFLENSLKDKHARPRLAPVSQSNVGAYLAMLHIASGNHHKARVTIRKCPLRTAEVHIVSAHLARATGNLQKVFTDGPKAMKNASPRHRASFLLLKSITVLKGGNNDAALELLDAACELMSTNDLRSPLAFLSQADAGALQQLASTSTSSTTRAAVEETPFAPVLPPPELSAALTVREVEVIQVLATAVDTKEVAERLFVSINTVKSQLRSAYRKLGVSSREEALLEAVRQGILDHDYPET
ncbi:hypothetical protein CVV67_10850 [Arthrobacter stackebrandtii]|nr:hypothetical protein CVV67_10850 [Arthrobacter stackebrandtii]